MIYLVTSVFYSGYFGQGTGPLLLYNLRCTGTESSLLSCSHSVVGVTSCSHSNDAGVACSSCKLYVSSSVCHIGTSTHIILLVMITCVIILLYLALILGITIIRHTLHAPLECNVYVDKYSVMGKVSLMCGPCFLTFDPCIRHQWYSSADGWSHTRGRSSGSVCEWKVE